MQSSEKATPNLCTEAETVGLPQPPKSPQWTSDITAGLPEQIARQVNRRLAKLESKRSAMVLPKGLAWNPLRELPRNRKCPCLSGKKFKVCHLSILPKVVTTADAENYRAQMEKPDFQTPENKELLEKFAKDLVKGNGL